MSHTPNATEQRILEILRRHRTMTMEHLLTAVPELSWNCVFGAVDHLSRDGRITVRRRGFDYLVSVAGNLSRRAAPAA